MTGLYGVAWEYQNRHALNSALNSGHTRTPNSNSQLQSSSMPSDVPPIRKQYLDLKRQYPHAILFFRLGDFYETFDADAELVARELDIVLTSRNIAKDARVPMAG